MGNFVSFQYLHMKAATRTLSTAFIHLQNILMESYLGCFGKLTEKFISGCGDLFMKSTKLIFLVFPVLS